VKNLPIPVLFENERCVVFDKPSGLLTIPSPKGETKTLTSLVNDQYAPADKSYQLHPCHRLDKDTTGVILYAKGKKNQQLLMDEFKRQRVHKKYIAFVQGRMKRQEGEIKSYIHSFEDEQIFNKDKKDLAQTRFKVLELRKDFSVVEVEPLTGRTNQIRIHFKHIKHPLVGDRKYSFARDFHLKFRRTALHAARLEWRDPEGGKHLTAQAPLAKDMKDFLEKNQ